MNYNYNTERHLQRGNLKKSMKFSKKIIEIMRTSVFNKEKSFYSRKLY